MSKYIRFTATDADVANLESMKSKLQAHELQNGQRLAEEVRAGIHVTTPNRQKVQSVTISNTFAGSGMARETAGQLDAAVRAGFVDQDGKVTSAGRLVGLDQDSIDRAISEGFGGGSK